LSQERIGWQHFFAGNITQEWLKEEGLLCMGSFNCQNHIKVFYIIMGNEEVHGKTTEQQETTGKTKLSIDARKLNSLKDKAQPVDMGLFHADIEEVLDNSITQTIATFTSSHRNATANSVMKYAAALLFI
jgi:hypothetical protein